jgi:polysaccharide biosynthesis transport protein
LMVRDEAIGAAARPGKFQQPDEMKTVQETILELARSRTVLSAALAEVGPDSQHTSTANWPTDAAIAALQSVVKLTPPKGAEFGKTEVFYLNVQAETRPRAIALAAAICKQLQARSQELRDQKAQSLIVELTKTVDLAQADLTFTTAELTNIETRVGADLGELRVLNEVGGGDSPLRRSINEMDQELRQAHQAIDANQELLSMLNLSKADTKSLVAAPNRLLEAQPVLRRLKDGLVDAQLRTAQLSGNLTDQHPSVMTAKIAEQEIESHVRGEINSAIAGVQAELRLSQERAELLESQLNSARQRLAKLAEMRAQYANVLAERNQRADIVKTAEQQLAEARASQAAARTASLIAAIDTPVGGDYPVGPSKAVLVLGGLLSGFVLGLGIVFLTVQPSKPEVEVQPVAEVASTTNEVADDFVLEPSVHPTGHPTLVPKDLTFSSQPVNGNAAGHKASGSSLSLKQALSKLAVAR